MPKTFANLVSANPKVEGVQITVDNNLNLTGLTVVILYDVQDAGGGTVSTNRVKIDLLAKFSATVRNGLTTALKTYLTSAVNEYA